MSLREICCEDMNWTELAKDHAQCQWALLMMNFKLQCPEYFGYTNTHEAFKSDKKLNFQNGSST